MYLRYEDGRVSLSAPAAPGECHALAWSSGGVLAAAVGNDVHLLDASASEEGCIARGMDRIRRSLRVSSGRVRTRPVCDSGALTVRPNKSRPRTRHR